MNENKAAARILIIVEGVDDERFLDWLAGKCGLMDVEVQSIGGVDKCRRELPALLSRAESVERTQVVAAVVDADTSPQSRRQSYMDCLALHAIGLRNEVYLLPNNSSSGELEDLYLDACRNKDLLACADAYVGCIEPLIASVVKPSKLRYQAYSMPIRPTQRGIAHTDFDNELDYDHPDIQKLAEFLRSLV